MNIPAPLLHLTFGSRWKKVDDAFGFDAFGRAASDIYRQSYADLPTASHAEFSAFFNANNYKKLFAETKRQCGGNEPDAGELFEAMMWGYSSVRPRSDEMDERRTKFTNDVTRSYVNEMNAIVLERTVPDTVAANKLWEHYAKYRNGPTEEWGDDEDMHFGVDTRTRFNVSKTDMTWLMP
jgi:hypothetical protein